MCDEIRGKELRSLTTMHWYLKLNVSQLRHSLGVPSVLTVTNLSSNYF